MTGYPSANFRKAIFALSFSHFNFVIENSVVASLRSRDVPVRFVLSYSVVIFGKCHVHHGFFASRCVHQF